MQVLGEPEVAGGGRVYVDTRATVYDMTPNAELADADTVKVNPGVCCDCAVTVL